LAAAIIAFWNVVLLADNAVNATAGVGYAELPVI
jgi:hypothetical protein